jgi:Transcriptional regulator, AbiEi antitoxin/Protein of unknown function (DUF559)
VDIGDAAWWSNRYDELSTGRPAERLAAQQGFVLTRAQALAHGMAPRDLRRLCYQGRWLAVRRGVLSPIGDLGAGRAAALRRHCLECTAAALVRPGAVIARSSGAVIHGLPVLTVPAVPELLIAAPLRAGRRPDARLLSGRTTRADVTGWYGAAVATVARLLVDVARDDARAGLVAADAARRDRCVTGRDVEAMLRRARGWPGVRRAREVLALASPLAESPLESIVRLAAQDSGLPMPELQVEIRDPRSGRVDRVDMLWRAARLILEADGRLKYTGDELWAEKRREERLVRQGYRVIRVMWSDVVGDWDATCERIRAALAATPLG